MSKNHFSALRNNLVCLVQYGFTRIISWIVCLIPFRWALMIARPIGAILFFTLKRPRQMAIQNLKSAFPEKSETEIKSIAQVAFRHLAEFGIEWLMMPEMIEHSKKYLIKEVIGKEKIPEGLAQKRGAIVLVTHTANWEVMALIMGGLLTAESVGAAVYALARPLKNPYLYQYAVKIRAGRGLKTINKFGGVRETFDRLRKDNAVMCILIDQRISEGGIETNFFGRPALTTSLPVMAALRLGTPIFFSFMRQTDDLRYEMKIEGPVPIARTRDFKKDIITNTQNFAARAEAEIRKNPSHWLWMHNRWRVAHGAK